MELIESLMVHEVPIWYRGSGNSAHRMVPSLFRHPSITNAEELIALETDILQRFRERSIPYQPRPSGREADQDWELLFLMQHFGVPTRLLDWTENPYIALFFALTSCEFDYKTNASQSPTCVWVLEPHEWNRKALADISYQGGILSTGSEPLKSYGPSANVDYMRVLPVAMYGLHNSPRIVAQKGVFTIFGKDTQEMETVFVDSSFPENALIKIEFPDHVTGALRDTLFRIGITDSVVYPDLEGLAVELKRFFGFHV